MPLSHNHRFCRVNEILTQINELLIIVNRLLPFVNTLLHNTENCCL